MRLVPFGRLRDCAPVGAVPASVTDLDSLRSWLSDERPELVADSIRIAVNDELVQGNRPLAANDEIAFLPPVSGG